MCSSLFLLIQYGKKFYSTIPWKTRMRKGKRGNQVCQTVNVPVVNFLTCSVLSGKFYPRRSDRKLAPQLLSKRITSGRDGIARGSIALHTQPSRVLILAFPKFFRCCQRLLTALLLRAVNNRGLIMSIEPI